MSKVVTLTPRRFNAVMKRETKLMSKKDRARYVQIMFMHSLVYEQLKKGGSK